MRFDVYEGGHGQLTEPFPITTNNNGGATTCHRGIYTSTTKKTAVYMQFAVSSCPETVFSLTLVQKLRRIIGAGLKPPFQASGFIRLHSFAPETFKANFCKASL